MNLSGMSSSPTALYASYLISRLEQPNMAMTVVGSSRFTSTIALFIPFVVCLADNNTTDVTCYELLFLLTDDNVSK